MATVLNAYGTPYQEHFERALGNRAKRVLELLRLDTKPIPVTLSVVLPTNSEGMRIGLLNGYPWNMSAFSRLDSVYTKVHAAHPLHRFLYGDEATTRDQPENIRRAALQDAILEVLQATPEESSLVSLVGSPRPVEGVYLVPILRVDRAFLEESPFVLPSPVEWDDYKGHRSIAHAAMAVVLGHFTEDLERPEPGRWLRRGSNEEELVWRAVQSFMFAPALAIKDRQPWTDLLELVTNVAALLYEQSAGVGNLLLVNPGNPHLRYDCKFTRPVPFRDAGWTRKILQMAASGVSMVATHAEILGIGHLDQGHDPAAQDAFLIEFLGHHRWQMRCGERILIRSEYGSPFVPSRPISEEKFIDNYVRLFPSASATSANLLWQLFNEAVGLDCGSMMVVADDAALEATRLQNQATPIEPTLLTSPLLRRFAAIDGSILVDPEGRCHAIGVILDGVANERCKPSRGSRYNSAIRYVFNGTSPASRLALVVSEDGSVEILPLLRPRVRRSAIEAQLAALEKATSDDYHGPKSWLDTHRFYLDAEHCRRANVASERIGKLPTKVGRAIIDTTPLSPHPGMNPSYYLPE